MDLTYYEQRVQETFERLSVLHSSEENKADFFITKAWESYWRRMELTDWLNRMNKGYKKKGDYLNRPMSHWRQVYI